ncbi:MAG: hypothetical protein WCC17_11190 [Candidatus Nitrosopolaris sp.]
MKIVLNNNMVFTKSNLPKVQGLVATIAAIITSRTSNNWPGRKRRKPLKLLIEK